MAAEIRIKGRILLLGNMTLLTLVLLCFVGIVFISNLTVMFYENILLEKISFIGVSGGIISDFAVSVFLFLFSFSIYSVIKLGTERFFLRRAQKKDASAKDIFYYFHPFRFFGAFFFMLKLRILYSLIMIFCMLPFCASVLTLLHLLKNNTSVLVAFIIFIGAAAFLISGLIFFYKIKDTLFLCSYYYLEGEYFTFRKILSSSQAKMKNNLTLLHRIRMGFLGWLLLCAFVFPVGYVWSYYNQTLSVASVKFMKD